MVSWVMASTPSRALLSGFLPHLSGRDWEACFASCACVSQGVWLFLKQGWLAQSAYQWSSHIACFLRGKTEFMGTVLSYPRVGLVPLVRTCLQLNALDAFEFDFLFFLLVTL